MHPYLVNILKVTILVSKYSMDKVIVFTDLSSTCPGVTDQGMCFTIDVVHLGGLSYVRDTMGIPASLIKIIEA